MTVADMRNKRNGTSPSKTETITPDKKQLRPVKLQAVNIGGSGCQIHALIPESVDCVEFGMKGNCNHCILQLGDNVLESCVRGFIGYEPWIQFAPTEWQEMIGRVFKEMAEAWNEKYSTEMKKPEAKNPKKHCGIRRMWINQPSKLQAYHKWHGRNVIADMGCEGDRFVTVYFTEGDIRSMGIEKSALSEC